MPTMEREFDIASGERDAAPAQHYSKIVKFIDEAARGEPNGPPISVDIFGTDGKWYCQVRRGAEETKPLGPYTKRQAERIQDARKMLIAKRGAARLVFEWSGDN